MTQNLHVWVLLNETYWDLLCGRGRLARRFWCGSTLLVHILLTKEHRGSLEMLFPHFCTCRQEEGPQDQPTRLAESTLVLNEAAHTKARLLSHPKPLFQTCCCTGPQSTKLKVNTEGWSGGSAVKGTCCPGSGPEFGSQDPGWAAHSLLFPPSEVWDYRCVILHLFYVVALCMVSVWWANTLLTESYPQL